MKLTLVLSSRLSRETDLDLDLDLDLRRSRDRDLLRSLDLERRSRD